MTHRHVTRMIDLPDAKISTIAVISDTHGKPHSNLFPALERNRPSLILHAGDVGDLDLITELEGISQTVYVRGNTDSTGPMWPESVFLRIRLETSRRLDLLLLHFAVARLRLNKETQTLLKEDPAQIVVYGHSHIPFLGERENIILFNPGSAGPPRMGLPITIGLIEISDQTRFRHLDLRTGEQWKPTPHIPLSQTGRGER